MVGPLCRTFLYGYPNTEGNRIYLMSALIPYKWILCPDRC